MYDHNSFWHAIWKEDMDSGGQRHRDRGHYNICLIVQLWTIE